MSLALDIKNVQKNYGSFQAVKDISLQVPKGEIFGLLGPNGAGKSTLIKMIGGLSHIDQGQIKVFDHDVSLNPLKSKTLTGIMPQEIALENFFPIGQALKFHSGFYGVPDDPQWRHLLIERLGLGPYLSKKPMQLSGGTKRRFMCAKALIHKPQLVILDEPTAGVDVELRKQLWDFVSDLKHHGFTVLLTTHYIEEAERMCDRIGIIQQGRLIALDTTQNLKSSLQKDLVMFQFSNTPDTMVLQKLGLCPTHNQLQWTAQLADLDLCPLLEQMFQAKLHFEKMEIKKPSLEDVFVKMTQDHGP